MKGAGIVFRYGVLINSVPVKGHRGRMKQCAVPYTSVPETETLESRRWSFFGSFYLQKFLVAGGERCENYSCFKVKVTASLICVQPVLKQQLRVEEEKIMIKVITVPLSLPWEYKGKYMRCRSHAFILPINLMKYLWDHDKHNIIKQVKVQLCIVFCTVISEDSVKRCCWIFDIVEGMQMFINNAPVL